jgi:hypothetical protein
MSKFLGKTNTLGGDKLEKRILISGNFKSLPIRAAAGDILKIFINILKGRFLGVEVI